MDCSHRWCLAETGADHAASVTFYGLQPLSRSSSSLPRRRARMVAPGGALNTERTWQTPSVDEVWDSESTSGSNGRPGIFVQEPTQPRASSNSGAWPSDWRAGGRGRSKAAAAVRALIVVVRTVCCSVACCEFDIDIDRLCAPHTLKRAIWNVTGFSPAARRDSGPS
jgi:hypothetical protein